MSSCKRFLTRSKIGLSALFLSASLACASSGTWTGAADACWTNSLNWSASPFPSGNEVATFSASGSGQPVVDVAGLSSISNLTFSAGAAGAYTIGAGGAKAQTLVLEKRSLVKVEAACAHSPVINANIQLGAVNAATTNILQNDSTACALTVAGDIVFPPTGGVGYQKSVYFSGAGETRVTGDFLKGAFTCVVYANGGSQLTLAGSNHVNAVRFEGVPRVVIDGYCFLDNTAWYPLLANANGELSGAGTLRFNPVTADGMVWILVGVNKTLTVNVPIYSPCGLSLRESSGTLVLNALNDIGGNIAISNACTLSVAIVGNRGSATSNLGRGDRVIFNGNGSRLLYTGSGETSDRILELNNSAVLDQSGTGTLTFTEDLSVGGTVKTLTLQGSSAGTGELRGAIGAGTATTSLAKGGAGTWRLAGANTCAGSVAVNGGTLVVSGAAGSLAAAASYAVSTNSALTLENAEAENLTDRLSDSAAITLNGGTLNFTHSGGAADYSESAGALRALSGKNRVTSSQAREGRTSSLTFASLEHGAGLIDFVGAGLGESDRNRVFITGQAEGVIGPWATVNGTQLAAYSSSLGVYPAAEAGFHDIAARGPDSVIPDNAAAFVRINLPGEAGPITLAGEWTNTVAALLQNAATGAVVAARSGATNKTLRAGGLRIAADKAALTLGENEGDGFLMSANDGEDLLLSNESTSSVLTVNTVLADNGGAATLIKTGPGDVSLNAKILHAGSTVIDAGRLTFASSSTQSLAGVVSGAGGVVKAGAGTLRLGGNNAYAGETLVSAGTLVADHSSALGPGGAGTIIASGATLDVGGAAPANTLKLGAETITISGTGADGKGALVNSSAVEQRSAFYGSKVSLSGDAAVGGSQRLGFWPDALSPLLDLNGYTLTKLGANIFSLINVDTAPGGGQIDVQSGDFWLVYSTRLNGGATNVLTLRNDALLSFYMLYEPQSWTLALNNRSRVYTISGGVPLNTWGGPVTLNGTAFLGGYNNPTYSLRLSGPVSGSGSLVKTDLSAAYLASTNNTYTGDTIVSNGVLTAEQAGSLPGYATPGKIKIAPAGTLAAMTGDGTTGWSQAQLETLRTAAAYASASSAFGLDTSFGDSVYSADISHAYTLAKVGTNTLTLAGKNTITNLQVRAGTLTLGASSTNAFASVFVTGGQAPTLDVKGPLTLVNYGSVTNGGAAGDRSVMRIATNLTIVAPGNASVAAGKLFVGTGAGATGAVYQTAGRVSVSAGLMYTDFVSIGNYGGYGYYRMTGGELASGEIGITGAGSGGNVGVFDLYGGSVSNDGAGFLIGWSQGVGVLNLYGGSLVVTKNTIHLTYTQNKSSFGMINLLGPSASVNATATTPSSQYLNMAYTNGNKASVVNLNSGTFRINKIYAGSAGTPSFFNFNGGVLRPNANQTAFLQGLSAATVYPGGAVIDSAGFNIDINQPLRAPAGYGVAEISLTSGGAGYIGAPAVQISGGVGTNATAIAQVDLEEGSPTKGQVTGILVTSPGFDYQAADSLAVTLLGGGALTAAKAGAVTKSLNASGGLTKLGAGTLRLGGVNTYAGATVISNGTLKLGNAQALPTGTKVVLDGGTLDLNGYTVTNSLGGTAGTVSNGTLVATFSPAGAGAIGSDTFTPGTAAVTGKYLADVAADGGSDSLTIQGSFNLSTLSLELVNPALLNSKKVYTLARVTGVRSGVFGVANLNLPDSRWHVIYSSDGSVKLVFTDGTLLMMK